MRRARQFGCVLGIALFAGLLFLGGTLSAQQTSLEETESYAVYSALIPNVKEQPQAKYLIGNETLTYDKISPVDPENIVTREEFDRQLQIWEGTPRAKMLRLNQPCVLAPEAERGAYWSAMVDYQRKNESPIALERRFHLSKPYELVSAGKLPSDVYELSAVGFSSDMTFAIVYAGFNCLLCGRQTVHVLKKTNGKWREIGGGCGYRG